MNSFRIISTILIFYSASYASARTIQAASNIESGRVILSVTDGQKRSPPKLIQLDLTDFKQSSVPWPADFKQEEVMGLLQVADSIVLIAQFTQGGGKYPHIYQYDISKKTWASAGELKCLSFDTLTIKASVLRVDCEADHRKSESKSSFQSIQLPANKLAELKAVLPITADKNSKFAFKLKGEMFSWKSIEIQNQKLESKNLQL